MNLYVKNAPAHLMCGVEEFLKFHGHNYSENGVPVVFTQTEDKKLCVRKTEEGYEICASEASLIFRGLTKIFSEDFGEEPVFCSTRGIMIDGSQKSALLNVPTCKLFLRIAAGMGYNMFMLYTEDCYEIESEPYFGYMRPKYTQKDFKEIDDYSILSYNPNRDGIENFTNLQTLTINCKN